MTEGLWTLEVLLANGASAAFRIPNDARRQLQARLADRGGPSGPAGFVFFDTMHARVALKLRRLVHATLEPIAASLQAADQPMAPDVLRVWTMALPQSIDLKILPGEPHAARHFIRLDSIFAIDGEMEHERARADGRGVLHVRQELVTMAQVAKSTLNGRGAS